MSAEQNNTDIQVKACSKCGEVKAIDEFYRDRRRGNPQGRRSSCKKCDNEVKKEYLSNPVVAERRRKQKSEYNNKAEVKERQKIYNEKYYNKNKQQLIEYNKKYYKDNIQYIKDRNKVYSNRPDVKDKRKQRNIKRLDDLKEIQLKYLNEHEDKECIKCGEIKSIHLFFKDKYTDSGFTYKCKDCFVKYKANYRKRPEVKRKERLKEADARQNLADRYVKQRLRTQSKNILRHNEIPPHLIEAKREILKLKRLIKSKTKNND